MVDHQTKYCKKLIIDEKKAEVKCNNNRYYLSTVGTEPPKNTVDTDPPKNTVDTEPSKYTVDTDPPKYTVGTKPPKNTVGTNPPKNTVGNGAAGTTGPRPALAPGTFFWGA